MSWRSRMQSPLLRGAEWKDGRGDPDAMPGISVEISASVAAAERGSLRAAASRSSHAIPCRRALGGSAMSHAHGAPRDFIPAAGRHFLLPLYDPFTRWLGVGA